MTYHNITEILDNTNNKTSAPQAKFFLGHMSQVFFRYILILKYTYFFEKIGILQIGIFSYFQKNRYMQIGIFSIYTYFCTFPLFSITNAYLCNFYNRYISSYIFKKIGIFLQVYKIYLFLQIGIFFVNRYIFLNIPKKKTYDLGTEYGTYTESVPVLRSMVRTQPRMMYLV